MLKYLEDITDNKEVMEKLKKKYEDGKLVVADIGKKNFFYFISIKKRKGDI